MPIKSKYVPGSYQTIHVKCSRFWKVLSICKKVFFIKVIARSGSVWVRLVFNTGKRRLPCTLKLNDIYEVGMYSPQLLVEFLNCLIVDPAKHQVQSEAKRRWVDSISQDIVFAATNGLVKPGKHLHMGIAMKSLTGIRKILETLNRLDHSVSCHVAEELETKLNLSTDLCRRGAVVKGVEHISTIVFVNIRVARVRVPLVLSVGI